MENDIINIRQLALNFSPHTEMGRSDFMVSACNHAAFSLIDSWPNWYGSGVLIYGPKGCGKSHLANLFVQKIQTFTPKPMPVKIIAASAINMRNIKHLALENIAIVIENVSANNNNEALFHLFNLFNTEGKYMLWTANQAPNYIKFPLKDLQTRINMLPNAAISEPDDIMLQMLIVKLFNDRQIKVSADIPNYIINNAPRSFAFIEKLIEEIDKISLAYKSAVNYIIIKKAIKSLQIQNNQEPDLFDDYPE